MMTEFRALRLSAQQLVTPRFETAEDVVAWFGAMQGQDYNAVKWAVGMRLKGEPRLSLVQKAFDEGKILRTHVMRPTWHIISAEDIRWMCALSAASIQSVIKDRKRMEALALSEDLFAKACKLFEKHLAGSSGLTKDELEDLFVAEGVTCVTGTMYRLLMFAETVGLVCSGVDKGGKPTYALLDERVPAVSELSREESIVRLAERYFRSHSPATLADFVWWSGLGVREARAGVEAVKGVLHELSIGDKTYYVHQEGSSVVAFTEPSVHLLPAYDEYTIAYKDRGEIIHAMGLDKCSKNGTFYPLIADHGHVVGLWKYDRKKKSNPMSVNYFEPGLTSLSDDVQAAFERYKAFTEE
ncbi:winged helix DNA-binding domain-containing protein [Porphyromonas cangingivalis]|uniref:winged helix DNA-binding domain-containing protein n=1 Tax=Porphyromonas cangingivalis TaxID=36874 RepID=UPI002431DB1B|nr:winged helix DNA-binding domain-containing protein [Porphyromonas cangingivalis]